MFTSLKELKKVKSIIMAQKQIKNMISKSSERKEIIKNLIFYLLIMSLQLGIFNLLPIVGLDGFWILVSIISLIFKPKLSNQRKLITVINYCTYLVFITMGLILFRDIYDIVKEFFV
jgi:membrane-associated protease RseP (regulator of RpoE activity)